MGVWYDTEMESVLCIFSQLVFIIFFNNLDDAIQSTIIKSWDDTEQGEVLQALEEEVRI